jgi:hypothetical protein
MRCPRTLAARLPIWVRASGVIALVLVAVVVTSILLGGSDLGAGGHRGQTAGIDHGRGGDSRGMDHGDRDSGMDHGGDGEDHGGGR